MVNKLALTILVSIILTVIIVSLVNVGVSLFLDEPEWEDYCGKVEAPTRVVQLEPGEPAPSQEEQQQANREFCETQNILSFLPRKEVRDILQ